MARVLKIETVTNLSDKYGKLRNALADISADEEALVKNVEAKVLTPAMMTETLTRMNRNRAIAIETASYLGSAFGTFLGSIAETNPEVLVQVTDALKPHLPNIVEAMNDEKKNQKETAKQKRDAEIMEKARVLAQSIVAQANEKNKK